MWARAQSSWQLAWRSMPQVPQSLVSATCFVHGAVATAAAAAPAEGNVPVMVLLNDAKLGLEKAELPHPQPISMIQWRPLALYANDRSEVRREILLTCCLDGTARLWTEDEVVRSKKQRASQRSFSVVAVIELNNILNGVLGIDVTVKWALETGSVMSIDEEGKFKLFSGDSGQNQVGKCEWLVSVGPGTCINFWAVHCLDDVCPPRYPRITLWKQSKLQASDQSVVKGLSKSLPQSIFLEALISRRISSGPPTTCSLLHLLPDSSFIWSHLSFGLSSGSGSIVSTDSSRSISCCPAKAVDQDGHKGSIIQVSVHPYSCEIELAASMDSSSMLFLWSLLTLSTLVPTLHAPTYPLWKLLCKIDLRDISADEQYSCLCWAPSVVHDNRFLVLGGEHGADFFAFRIPKGDVVSCHKMFTVPFIGGSRAEGPPDSIHTIPLASNCIGPFVHNSFLVVCLWQKTFQALSWKIVLHSEYQHEEQGCLCGFAASSFSTEDQGRYISYVHDEMFSAVIYEGSSIFPAGMDGEYPTSISVMPLNNTVLPLQQHGPSRTVPGYHIATGCSDGTVKLWKMACADNPLQTEKENNSWELVGMFGAHQGPVIAISLSGCGRVATVGRNIEKNSTSIHIWEAVKLMGDGSFLLEDALMIQSPVVGLDWLSLGDGRLLLAVYLHNELHIYAHKHPSFQNVLHTVNSKQKHLWSCIALAHSHHDIAGFLWGPKATLVLVHKNHLSLFTSWLVRRSDEYITQEPVCSAIDVHAELPYTVHFNETIFGKFGLSEDYSNMETIENNSTLLTGHHNSHASNGLWSLLDISSKLSGPLPSYHPRALIHYLYSGEWRRADAVLQHLVQSMKARTMLDTMCSSCSKSCHNIPELPLSQYFTDTPPSGISNKGLLWGDNGSVSAFNLLSPPNSFHYMESDLGINSTASACQRSEINHLLDKNFGISAISAMEKTQILAISDLVGEITDQNRTSPYKSLDEAGRRFWIAVQFKRLYVLRQNGDSSIAGGCHVDSASIAWAFQSDCQDDLLNYVLPGESSWSEMRNLGIGFWYTNVPQLRTRLSG